MTDFERSISISLQKDTTDPFSEDWLRLEQPEFLTGSEKYGSFSDFLYSSGLGLTPYNVGSHLDMYNSNCAEDGTLVVEIQVHRSRNDLLYTITNSYGELSETPVVVDGQIHRSYTVQLEDNFELESVPNGEISAIWEGQVFGADGVEVLPPPTIVYEDGFLIFGQKVLGTFRVSYWNQYDSYYLTIVPRPEDESEAADRNTAYQSTVNAIWGDGNLETLEVNIPQMTGGCGRPTTVVDPDEDDPDEEACYKHVVIYDPCTSEIIEEFDEQIACEDESGAELTGEENDSE